MFDPILYFYKLYKFHMINLSYIFIKIRKVCIVLKIYKNKVYVFKTFKNHHDIKYKEFQIYR